MLKTELMELIANGDARGMGIRRKVVPLMRDQNAHEPQFEATEDFLKTTLRRAAAP